MTSDGGSEGHEPSSKGAGYGGNATWTNPNPAWETRRMPDAVRAAALANAVDLCRQDNDVTTEEVLNIAREFEAYLTGEEAPSG